MEYCSMTVNGEDLDAFLVREEIIKIICTICTPKYEHHPNNIFQYCEDHEPSEAFCRAERMRVNAALRDRPEKKKRARSDGKVDIDYKYRKCLTRAERRARKKLFDPNYKKDETPRTTNPSSDRSYPWL